MPALKAIYTAPTEAAAEQALAEFEQSPLGQRYPAIGRTWRAAWPKFTPFLTFPPKLRKVVYSTNLIESINARLRKITRTAATSRPSRPRSRCSGWPSGT